ncbi:transglutaminase family protein [Roseitranquillus sediminis]|uniref:transglutaminase family protein n=1 Tax=Roseitranquillus sediminis TaxID=2809051 RepID=UPI001D0C80A9|nr:transglutaminase family protein [Roseitranquillus sediminis]MBM9595669.1 transglutaminase family protein [Roseitranquillus sediminis]
MLYDVGLTISYEYDGPASSGRHVLRLRPLELGAEQRVIASRLMVEPEPTESVEATDFFGTATRTVAFDRPHEHALFQLKARVRREPRGALLDMSPDAAGLAREIALHRSLSPDAPHHFAGASPRVVVDTVMTDWARRTAREARTVYEAVQAVGRALMAEMKFDPDATQVDTPAREAFDARHGVCQDFTHIMIACLRGIGIPAGYVSGFIRTIPPPGKERLEGADAMHAWVRAWCGIEMGWVEYDPTNAMLAGADHIVVAYGRDYADVAPVRGVTRSAGGQSTTHAVDVIPLD